MKRVIIIAMGFAALSGVRHVRATQFAAEVVSYKPGTGFATDLSTGVGFTNKEAIIGAPARETPGEWGGPITPFSPPYLREQILSIGQGGEVTLEFARPIRDEALNPFGLDFIVFGGAGFTITNGDFSGGGLTDGTLFGQADGETRVSVSADGDAWFVLNPEQAPAFDAYHPTDGGGDFGLPVNLVLGKGDFAGGGLAKLAELYAGSGGGTGYDIAWAVDAERTPVELGQARFIRLEVLSGKAEIDAVAEDVAAARGQRPTYLVGTMIELPRAALRAAEIASTAEFFSFGTNDLTQTTFGISRDDSAHFLEHYLAQGVIATDPFVSLDQDGVGELVTIAAARGRGARPDLKLGICGEHGGDPASIAFCHRAGLDYVSCSPYRVPIARLAAAQAAIGTAGPDGD